MHEIPTDSVCSNIISYDEARYLLATDLTEILDGVCHPELPDETLKQLVAILVETPINSDLTTALGRVIPLVIGNYVLRDAPMAKVLSDIENTMHAARDRIRILAEEGGNENHTPQEVSEDLPHEWFHGGGAQNQNERIHSPKPAPKFPDPDPEPSIAAPTTPTPVHHPAQYRAPIPVPRAPRAITSPYTPSILTPVRHAQRTLQSATEREAHFSPEYQELILLLKLTCSEGAAPTFEEYIQQVTQPPRADLEDTTTLEFEVVVVTRNILSPVLLVPLKPFTKHVVDILLRKSYSTSRSEGINLIQQELTAACSKLPFHLLRIAATLISHIPNDDDDLSSTIEAVIMGMLSANLIVQREELVDTISKLRRFPAQETYVHPFCSS